MKRIAWIFGLIIGAILVVNMIAMVQMIYKGNTLKGNDISGYTILVVIFSLIFFGVRNYRNRQAEGDFTFGKAFKLGALIAFIGATVYVAVWLFYYYLFVPDFMEVYTSCVLRQSPASELQEQTRQMASLNRCIKIPCL